MTQSIDIQQHFSPELCDGFVLRDYQHDLVEKIFSEWKKGHRRVMAQLPTAGGKTVTFAAIAKYFTDQNVNVLIMAHRKELVVQAGDKIQRITGEGVGYIKAGIPPEPHHRIQIASVQTLARRKTGFTPALIIIDESHHAITKSYTKVMEAFPNAYILGVSATPHRNDGQGFTDHFDVLVEGISVSELIQKGHLSSFKMFGAVPIDTTRISQAGGDYNQQQLQMQAMRMVQQVYPTWSKYAKDKKTIVFAVGVLHSQAIADEFNKNGVVAKHLDGESPEKEREEALEAFERGEITVLTNCGLFLEGLDICSIEAVQVCRPTCSLVLDKQMWGRGLRPFPGKEYVVLIDHTENWSRHGLPDEKVEWSLSPKSLKGDDHAIKCKSCEHCFRALPHELSRPVRVDDGVPIYEVTCPNCKSVLELKSGSKVAEEPTGLLPEEDEMEIQIKELTAKSNPEFLPLINKAIATQRKKGYEKYWVWHELVKRSKGAEFGIGDWKIVAQKLGYKPGWSNYAWRDAQVWAEDQKKSPLTTMTVLDSSSTKNISSFS
ncbi:DEAD/DEAH box helicase [Moorena sp. SIO3I8]|uniref:DEAD/DEAH box helicase n=1 Tax=Moorena sp. SIO3I8 TaxID=2607833 RepID=UPI0013BF4AB2|nr:DEAD/DEAH box helicase [Moorena sp. SIO3I8]NEO08429.1 DEAD/DEAH box helicase [Moorena sp. SIO3I8]